MYEYIFKSLLEAETGLVYFTSPSLLRHLELLKKDDMSFHYEMATDEKTAFELGLAGAFAHKRVACVFSTEEIYETMDPLMTSAYTGVKKGFIIVCIKDTPHEASFIGLFSKLPVISIEGDSEFPYVVDYCFNISEKYEIPIILQVSLPEEGTELSKDWKDKIEPPKRREARFIKDPNRWAATPSFRFKLHQILNKKIEDIREEFETYKGNEIKIKGKTGIITPKKSFADFYSEDTSTLMISTIFPLPERLVEAFINQMDEVYLIEEEHPALELQIRERCKIKSEIIKVPSRIEKRDESLYGFLVIRDWCGPASSINIAHGIKKTDADKKIVAITFENHFFHSGMPAFVNVLYNNSSFVLLIIVSEGENEIRRFMEGCGFKNFFHIRQLEEIKDFKDNKELTVLFYRGMI
ncbi:MAG: hypothetical protein N2596_03050 [Syntrophorhabdaceae bacterium]|nr:hypothetical protein [Syntrophorhabdaceae bacterium]